MCPDAEPVIRAALRYESVCSGDDVHHMFPPCEPPELSGERRRITTTTRIKDRFIVLVRAVVQVVALHVHPQSLNRSQLRRVRRQEQQRDVHMPREQR